MNRTLCSVMLLFAAGLLSAQQAANPKKASKSANASAATSGEDHRPFGKYLVRVCQLGRGCYDPTKACKYSCGNDSPPASGTPATAANKDGGKKPMQKSDATPNPCPFCDSNKQPQSIALQQVGCPGTVPTCNVKPEYPIRDGQVFFIKATSDGLTATLTVSGPVVPAGATTNGVQPYTATTPTTAPIVIAAKQPGDATHLPAAPVSLTLRTAGPESANCYGLYTEAEQSTEQLDVSAIIGLVGNPVPFVLTAQGPTVLVYATRWPIDSIVEQPILDGIVVTLDGPLGGDPKSSFGVKAAAAMPKPFMKELRIAHAAALGDPATRINALGYKFTAQNIGSTPGKVRITASDTPKCEDWHTFLTTVRDLQWTISSQPPVTKLWYLSSDDAAGAITTLFPAPPSPPTSASSPVASPGSGSTASVASASSASSSNATISVSQPPGSKLEIKTDTTACVEAGLATGNSNACAPQGSSSSPSSASGASGAGGSNPISAAKGIVTTSIGIPNATPAAGQLPQSPRDMLIFGNPTPGDDAQIAERNRILAQLDLPRPEMIINAWVTQISTTNPSALGDYNNKLRTVVERYDDAVGELVLDAYKNVSRQMIVPDYYNRAFYHYVSDRFVAERITGAEASIVAEEFAGEQAAQNYLDRSPAELRDEKDRTDDLGICKLSQYCLGYSWLFNTAQPRLTDLLLALIAAQQPFDRAIETINYLQKDCCLPVLSKLKTAEGRRPEERQQKGDKLVELHPVHADCKDCPTTIDPRGNIPEFECEAIADGHLRDRCLKMKGRLHLRPVDNYLNPEIDCSVADEWQILRSQFASVTADPRPPRVHLSCFARAARRYLDDAGTARAAIADFLFEYKSSQQYPHEFSAYYLSQSAASLNSVLSPLIDAFNRDIVAFQTYMRSDIDYEIETMNDGTDQRCCIKRLLGIDKPSFFNDGIVSIRTISGQAAQVNATSQSFLDASKAPSLSDLMSAIGSGASASSGSPLASVLGTAAGTQAPVSLLGGLLNSYQKTYAQIGRQLQLQAVPRSLATASAAEISVYLKAGDPASAVTYSGGPPSAQQQNTSEVSNHEVTTRIRIDSVKLFELSSYSAVLQRSRSKFPLLPPFVELPYIGTIIGIPLAGAKEYHASTAFISAMVVPTAADIGFGLRFNDDLVLWGPAGKCSFSGSPPPACLIRRALSFADLHAPVTAYHQAILLCLMTEDQPARIERGLGPATGAGRKNYMSTASVQPNLLVGRTFSNRCENLSFRDLPRNP